MNNNLLQTASRFYSLDFNRDRLKQAGYEPRRVSDNYCNKSAVMASLLKYPKGAPVPQGESYRLSADKGFTLIEILISMSIIVLLAGITLTSITRSRKQIALNQTAQEVALILRDAQAKALSVSKVIKPSDSSEIFPGFGVSFDRYAGKIILFPDADNNKVLSINGPDNENEGLFQESKTYMVLSPVRMRGLTGLNPLTNSPENVDRLDVVYLRPDPTVYLSGIRGFTRLPPFVGSVDICLETIDSALSKIISVWTTGQVSVSGIIKGGC